MCARYTLTKSEKELLKAYQVKLPDNYQPNFNLAPTDNGLVITADQPDIAQQMHFGLVPHWAKDKKQSFKNARAETLLEKQSFRPLIVNNKRCLVIADGFYEWNKLGDGLPYRIVLPERDLFSFAGLWSRWIDSGTSQPYETFAIITVAPNEVLAPIHDRMPVILSKEEEKLWLSKELPTSDILSLCDMYPAEDMYRFRISKEVNFVKNNYPELMKPLDE